MLVLHAYTQYHVVLWLCVQRLPWFLSEAVRTSGAISISCEVSCPVLLSAWSVPDFNVRIFCLNNVVYYVVYSDIYYYYNKRVLLWCHKVCFYTHTQNIMLMLLILLCLIQFTQSLRTNVKLFKSVVMVSLLIMLHLHFLISNVLFAVSKACI